MIHKIEFEDVLRISRASDQIAEAITDMAPTWKRRRRLLQFETLYDMRGVVDDIPKLGVVFSTSVGLSAGVQIPPDWTGYSHLLIMPQLFRHTWNAGLIHTQSLLHHELAHILLGHEEIQHQLEFGSFEYFNHPFEIDAYTHQAIARLTSYGPSQQFSWTSGPLTPLELLGNDPSDFAVRVLDQYHPKARKLLSAQNLDALSVGLHQLHEEALVLLDDNESKFTYRA